VDRRSRPGCTTDVYTYHGYGDLVTVELDGDGDTDLDLIGEDSHGRCIALSDGYRDRESVTFWAAPGRTYFIKVRNATLIDLNTCDRISTPLLHVNLDEILIAHEFLDSASDLVDYISMEAGK